MTQHIFSMGGAHAELLRDTLRANGRDSVLWSRVWKPQHVTLDTIIVVRRDPIAAVLELYSLEGYGGKHLSPALVGARLEKYCEDAVREIPRLRSHVTTRTLYTEDHTKPRHWAASMHLRNTVDRDMSVEPVANEHELRDIFNRDLAPQIALYTETI